MAIYHMSIKNVSRGKGSSVVKAGRYCAGSHEYRGKREEVVHNAVIMPLDCPQMDYEELWQSLEDHEQRSNTRLAKRGDFALPIEATSEERIQLAEDFARQVFANHGYPCQIAIHNCPDGGNPHAHFLTANRPMVAGKWVEHKVKRGYALDADGNRIPVIDPATGKQKLGPRNRKKWEREKVAKPYLDRKETLQDIRKLWEMKLNDFCKKKGLMQVSCKSLKEQGSALVPTVHEGYSKEAREFNVAIRKLNTETLLNSNDNKLSAFDKAKKLELELVFKRKSPKKEKPRKGEEEENKRLAELRAGQEELQKKFFNHSFELLDMYIEEDAPAEAVVQDIQGSPGAHPAILAAAEATYRRAVEAAEQARCAQEEAEQRDQEDDEGYRPGY